MATVPSQATAAVGGKIPAATWNDDVRDAVNFFTANRPLTYLTQAVAQTGWVSAAVNDVTFSTEVLDRDGQHSTASNTHRVVIGNTLGWYRVSGSVVFAANTAITFLRVSLSLNGTVIDGSWASLGVVSGTLSASSTALSTNSVLVQATAASDWVSLQAAVTAASGTLGTAVSGGAKCSLTVEWMGS